MKITRCKVASLFLACALLAVSFTGCSSTKKKSSSNASGEKVTVTVWTQNRGDAAFITPQIDNFNKTNKDNIAIDYKMYTDNFQQALDMAFASNSVPDLVSESGYMAVFTRYVAQGKYLPIDKYMSDRQKDLYKDLKMEGINVYQGKYYYLPVFGTTGRLIYNKGILSKAGISTPPTTLNDLVADSKKITDQLKGQGVYGFAMNLKSPASAMQRSLDFMVERSGGPETGFDFKKGQYDFSFYQPFIEALKTIFTTDKSSFPGCESLDIDPLRTQFAAGKIGMYISWAHAEPDVYENQFPTTQDWGVEPLPTLNGKAYSQAIQPYGGLLITKGSKHYDADWAALNDFFYSETFDKAYYEAGMACLLPAKLLAAAKTPDLYKGKEEDLLGKSDKLWPATPDMLNSQAVIIQGNDEYATFAQMILGTLNIQSGLADLTKRYNDAYQQGISSGKGQKVQISNFDPANP